MTLWRSSLVVMFWVCLGTVLSLICIHIDTQIFSAFLKSDNPLNVTEVKYFKVQKAIFHHTQVSFFYHFMEHSSKCINNDENIPIIHHLVEKCCGQTYYSTVCYLLDKLSFPLSINIVVFKDLWMTNCHFLHDNVVNSFLIAPSSSSYFHLTFSPTYVTWHFYNVMYGYLWYVNCDSRLYKRSILKLKNRFCSRMLCWLIVVHYTSCCSNCACFIYFSFMHNQLWNICSNADNNQLYV